MSTRYCEGCGTPHECSGAGEGVSDAVRIAELETKRDVEVARVAARADREDAAAEVEVAEIEADASVEVATAEAEIIAPVLAVQLDGGQGDDPEPEPEGDPVVVEVPPDAGPPDAEAPPEHPEHHDTGKSGGGLSWY